MSLQAKTRLGPYEIVDFIGAGGMGEVYKARDTRLDRNVAIKIAAERFTQRFSTEAHVIAALNHPHICTLFDVGPNYLVMEYIEGESLAARIRAGPLQLDQALTIATQIARALEAAHRQGIVHRDLKPGNIMLTDSGAKLLDFGLAKLQNLQEADDQSVSPTLTGSGQLVGTLSYMSPEQLEGDEADARSDIFSFGAILYEMLTGQRAFQRQSTSATVAAISRAEPKPLRNFTRNVPDDLQRIVQRCLRKDPQQRYTSASDIVRQLEEYRWLASEPASGINFKVLLRQTKRPRVAIPTLLTIVLLAGLCGWWIERSLKARSARAEALPKISQLIDREKLGEAYALAVEAEKYIPGDPLLHNLWPKISWSATIRTAPSGATVFRRNFSAQNNPWESVGRSPIEKYRLPLVDSQWKFELAGFAPVERSTIFLFGQVVPSDSLSVTMDEDAKAPPGMIHQRDGVPMSGDIGSLQTTPVALIGLPGFEDVPPILLRDYWLDRYEVSNKQFKEFLDKGGYRSPNYWKQEFRENGRIVSWPAAIDKFRDATGRAGPATWALGDYPRGQENFPVSGVSWYEAAAYAEFAGKTLPTIYHWTTAASPWASASILPVSNFGMQGPNPAGTFHGMSWFGAYDMAGNVKEWCWNEAGSGRRYILGGAWDEPMYMFNNADARSPFERSPNFGFRCAKYSLAGAAAKAADPLTLRARDFKHEKPVSDELFRVYKSLYSYDKTPLHAIIESVDETEEWKKEKISFAAAYGNERISAYLFLPKKSRPPFQTIVYFPGSYAIDVRSSSTPPDTMLFDFIIKSGRAVIFPVYKGTFERGDDLKSDNPNLTSSWRDHVIMWSKDMGRSIDYLETRPDIDVTRLAYEGFSWGGAMGSVLPAVDDRIKVCALISPGFNIQRSLPEVDELNFAPRVKVPVLMLNGHFDFFYPPETSQMPMFQLLGTPNENKRRVVYETGHNIPRNELIKETLDWLDRYLGPVK
jgi:serine/threonine protein kinase/formylglycine-generating enzyme required for sulfatase activity/cephalosporin-C deacetylase-like acetyl esterase